MNILIVGCGRVGALLTRDLENAGHDISLIEKHADELRRLDSFSDYVFAGTAVVGDATDAKVLTNAGIENCDAVMIVGQDDAANLMTAQIAQKIFHKDNVVCRVSQTELAAIYKERYGLQTICPTVLTAEAMFQHLDSAHDA